MSNGDSYEGEFENGKANGHGRFKKHKDSEKRYNKDEMHEFNYTGEWKDNKPDGLGKQLENGQMYDGDFKQGIKEGQGTQEYRDGSIYVGAWKNNQKHGYGKMKYGNGDLYKGYFVNDRMDGKGVFSTKQLGKIYDGEWKNNVYHGHGEYYDEQSNQMKEGLWFNGKLKSYVDGHISKTGKTTRSGKTHRSGKTTMSGDQPQNNPRGENFPTPAHQKRLSMISHVYSNRSSNQSNRILQENCSFQMNNGVR